MKQSSRIGIIVLALTAILLSACGAGAAPAGGGKVQASPTAYTGIVESVSGTQWIVNGQAITVDPAVVQGGPFNVGDPVKVEGRRDASGAFIATSLTAPSAQDLASLPQLGSDDNSNSNDNANDNSNDDNANVNSNDDDINSNDDNANLNSNDDNGNTNINDNVNDDSANTNGNSNGTDDNSNGGGGNGNGNDDNSNGGGGNGNGGGGNDNSGGNGNGNDD